jgi:hypothetical protein
VGEGVSSVGVGVSAIVAVSVAVGDTVDVLVPVVVADGVGLAVGVTSCGDVAVAGITGVEVANWFGVGGKVTVGMAVNAGPLVAVETFGGKTGVSGSLVTEGVMVMTAGGSGTASGAI